MKKLAAILGIVVIIMIVVLAAESFGKDKNPPKISFNEDFRPTYVKGQDTKKLLADVKATDDKDGDVTKNLIIENYIDLNDGTAKLIYVAKDSSGNISKKRRLITYYSSKQKAEAAGLVVTDAAVETMTKNKTTASAQPVQTPAVQPETPILVLKQTEVTIAKGTAFEQLSYIESITDNKDSSADLSRRVRISGNYNINKAGTYTLQYIVRDSEGNSSEPVEMKLTVQ